MNFSRTALLWLAGCLVLGVLTAGCKPGVKKIKVKGQVTNAGGPLTVQSQAGVERLRVYFQPLTEGAEPPAKLLDTPEARVDSTTGTFEADLAPGKYRVCVEHFAGVKVDKFGGRFGKDKSPVIRTITDGKEEIKIDVTKPNG